MDVFYFVKYLALIGVGALALRMFYQFYQESLSAVPTRHDFSISDPDYCHRQRLMLFVYIGITVLTIHLAIYIVTYIGFAVFEKNQSGFFSSFQSIWYKWDTFRYLHIVENGYVTEGENKYNLAFYPLYPLLTKAVSLIIGNLFYSGMFVSLTCHLLASYVLFLLVEKEFNDRKIAWNTVKFFNLYPLAFFFGIVYTESLFLLLTITCFYFLRQSKWLLAGLFGLLAAFTRNQGIFLLIPFAIEVWQRYPIIRPPSMKLHFSRGLVIGIAGAAMVPLGFIFYLFVNKWVSGEYFTFLKYQEEFWHNSFGFFADNLGKMAQRAQNDDVQRSYGLWFPALTLFFVILSLKHWGVKKLPLSYLAYGSALLLISFSPTWTISGARYTSVIFPTYILLALWVNKSYARDNAITIASAVFLSLYAFLFTQSAVL